VPKNARPPETSCGFPEKKERGDVWFQIEKAKYK